MVMTEEEKKLTAYHEAGHAIVTINEKAAYPIHKATIIPREDIRYGNTNEKDEVSQRENNYMLKWQLQWEEELQRN